MQYFFKICNIIISVLIAFSAKSQVIITPTQLPQGSIAIDKPFFLQLNNNQNAMLNGQLQLTLSDGNKNIATITYQQVQLNMGLTTLNTFELGKVNENINSSELSSTRILTKGEIQLCFNFISTLDNTVLGNYCATIILNKPEEKQEKKTLLPIRFTGYAEVSGNYSNRQGSFQNLPANYTNVIVNPQLEVFGVPIGARFNYSTASDRNLQNMNLFSLYFDANKFRENMERKYLKNLSNDYLLEKSELGNYKEKAQELSKLNKILTNPYIVNELAKLDKVDSLDRLMQDSSPYLSAERTQLIQQELDSLEPIRKKRDAYQDLIKKQQALQRVVGIFENPVDTKLLEDSLSKLESKLNTTRIPFSADDEERLNNIDSLLSNEDLSKSRREVLKQQRDRLYETKKKKQEYEELKEKYANLHHTYEYQSKLDSLRKKRGDYSSVLNKDSQQDALRDPTKLKDKLKFLKAFKSINFGFFAPFTSELTLNGVPIQGFGTEMQFQKLFFGAAYGKMQRSSGLVTENNSPTPFDRNVASAWIGIGQQGTNFISFQVMDAQDFGEPLVIPNDSITLFFNNAGDNKIVSTQFKTTFFKGKTVVEGELAGSRITDNQLASSIAENTTHVQPASSWLANIINQTNTTTQRVGYGYKVALTQTLNKNTTQVSLSSKKIAPTYVSFGNPFMLTDIFMNEAKVTQRFFKGKLTTAGFYRINTDNLNRIKTFTTRNESFGGDLSLRIPNYPTVRIMYMPMVQQTSGNLFNTNLLTATSTYGLRKGSYYHQWTTLYTRQDAKGRVGYSNFTATNYTFSYFLSYKQKFTSNVTLNRIEQQSTDLATNGFMGTVSVGYLYKGKLNQQIGFTLADNNLGNRKSYFYDMNYPIFTNLIARLRFEKSNYLSNMLLIQDNSYIENLLTFSIVKKW